MTSAPHADPVTFLVLGGVVTVILLTEFTSNTATAAAFFPIVGMIAVGVGLDPLLMTLAVSCALMLPVAAPSNAVAFATGELPIRHMIRAGLWLNLLGVVLTVIALRTVVPMVFGTGFRTLAALEFRSCQGAGGVAASSSGVSRFHHLRDQPRAEFRHRTRRTNRVHSQASNWCSCRSRPAR